MGACAPAVAAALLLWGALGIRDSFETDFSGDADKVRKPQLGHHYAARKDISVGNFLVPKGASGVVKLVLPSGGAHIYFESLGHAVVFPEEDIARLFVSKEEDPLTYMAVEDMLDEHDVGGPRAPTGESGREDGETMGSESDTLPLLMDDDSPKSRWGGARISHLRDVVRLFPRQMAQKLARKLPRRRVQREGYRRHLDEHDDHGLTYEDEYNEDGLAELFDNSNEEQDFSIPRLQEHWYREVYDGDAVKVKVRRSWKRGRVVQVSSSWSVDGSETQTATVEYEGGLSRKRLAKVNTQSNMIKLLYGCFVVNESKVGESSGLPYHRTKDTDDKDRLVAPWGSLVQGIDQGDGWVRAENGYLPEKIGSRRVLHFRGWLEANDCSRWEKTKADAEEVRAKKTENTKKTVSKTVPTFSEVSVLDGKSHL